VPKPQLTPRTPLAAVAVPGRHGRAEAGPTPVVLTERRDLQLRIISARRGQAARVGEVVGRLTGLVLPQGPARVTAHGLALIGTAPDQWLAVAEDQAATELLATLTKELAGIASIIDQSDGKAVIRISGARARDALAKGCSLDLHPSVFQPGDAATTQIALIDCQLWQLDDVPTYDLAVPSSFAESFWSWLTASAAEYGYSVEP
jgi:heterotetrameric sarcosine oxidase gamma subunit